MPPHPCNYGKILELRLVILVDVQLSKVEIRVASLRLNRLFWWLTWLIEQRLAEGFERPCLSWWFCLQEALFLLDMF